MMLVLFYFVAFFIIIIIASLAPSHRVQKRLFFLRNRLPGVSGASFVAHHLMLAARRFRLLKLFYMPEFDE